MILFMGLRFSVSLNVSPALPETFTQSRNLWPHRLVLYTCTAMTQTASHFLPHPSCKRFQHCTPSAARSARSVPTTDWVLFARFNVRMNASRLCYMFDSLDSCLAINHSYSHHFRAAPLTPPAVWFHNRAEPGVQPH